MALVRVAAAAELALGDVMEVLVHGRPYALCHTAAGFYALAGDCPHRGGPLGHGALDDGHVVCPWHLWAFECRTGAYDRDPSVAVATVPVRVENGAILLEVTDHA